MKKARLVYTVAEQAVELREWKEAYGQLAQERDMLQMQGIEAQNELDKLRQARAQERAQPTEGEARTVLDDVRRVLDPPELVGTVQAIKDVAAELAATKEKLDRLDEANDALRDESERLKKDLEMRDADVEELRAQARSYRRTIRELRLSPKARGFADAEGPDTDPNVVDAGGEEGTRPRYEAREVRSPADVLLGYGVWDCGPGGWGERWYESPGTISFSAARRHAIARCEQLNRDEQVRLYREAVREGEASVHVNPESLVRISDPNHTDEGGE